MVIYKEKLEVTDSQVITPYCDAEILTVQVQNGTPCLWYKTNRPRGIKRMEIITVGTGQVSNEIEDASYIGTYQLKDDALVFHVFVR